MPESSPEVTISRAWVFQADPQVFDLRGALVAGVDLTWLTRQHAGEIHSGDRAYLWLSRPGGGIAAVTTVMAEPAPMTAPAGQLPFHLQPDQLDGLRPRVPVRVDQIMDPPIPRQDLLGHPVLREMDIIRIRRGTNFRVTDEQAVALEELVGLRAVLRSASRTGSLTRPLSEPAAELEAAQAERAAASSRLERHQQRPGGPDPHTYEWLDRAERRVAAAERRLGLEASDQDLDVPPFWAAFESAAHAVGFAGSWNGRTSLRRREGRIAWSVRVRAHDGEAEVLVEHGSRDENAELFRELASRAPAIELAYGGPLRWDEEVGRRRQRVAAPTRTGGVDDGPPWGAVWGPLLADLAALERALRPHLDDLGFGHVRQAPKLRTGWFGMPYQPADERAAVPRDPIVIDPDVIDRGTVGHMRTQNELAQLLRRLGLEPRSPRPSEPAYDLAWEHGGVRYVVEVKSLTAANEVHQLRLGLGQVLDYRHSLADGDKDVRAVLAVEHEPAASRWEQLCDDLGVRLVWPEIAEARLRALLEQAGPPLRGNA